MRCTLKPLVAVRLARYAALAVFAAIPTSLTLDSTLADVIYETDFESPTFVPGLINGQDGWSGAGVIQNSVAQSGNQALHLTGTTFQYASFLISETIGSDSYRFVADFRRDGAFVQSGISLAGNTGFIGQFVTPSGERYILGNTNSHITADGFAEDTWHRLRIDLDFNSLTMDGYVNNTFIGTIAINNAVAPTQITSISGYTFGSPATSSVYFDNFSLSSVSSVPEPSGFLLLSLAAMTVACRRRTWSRLDCVSDSTPVNSPLKKQ